MQNVGIRHLLRPKIETLKMFFHYLQDALPAKLEAMHIINCVSFFDMVLALVKPFMKSEIIKKVWRNLLQGLVNDILISDAFTPRNKL